MTKTAHLMVAVLCGVLLWTQCQATQWKKSIDAGMQASQQGRYTEAEQFLLAALKEAKDFGEQDSRLATTRLIKHHPTRRY